MRKHIRKASMTRLCRILLAFVLSFVFTLSSGYYKAFALTEKTSTFCIVTADNPLILEMWHYSGGYWKVGNNASSAITIKDSQIGRAINIGKLLSGNLSMGKKYTYWEETKAKLKEGDVISCKVFANGIPLYEIFDTSSIKGTAGDGYYSISFKPLFNISSLRTMDDYVAGLSVTIPLVDISYGENHYALYQGSSSIGDGRGYYSDATALSCPYGEIHPFMIADSSGKLKSGYTINNQLSNFQSDGYYVGNGTFKGGGAVGLKFIFPFYAEIYATRTEWVEDEEPDNPFGGDEPDDPGNDNPGGDNPDDPGNGTSDDPGDNPAEEFDPSQWRIHRLW